MNDFIYKTLGMGEKKTKKKNLMHIAPCSKDDLWQLLNSSQWFLFLEETKWLSVLENHGNQLQ